MLKKCFCCIFTLLIVLFSLASCSYSGDKSMLAGGVGMGAMENGGDGGDKTDGVQIQPGQITACAYDDNAHYSYWCSQILNSKENGGAFYDYYNNYRYVTHNRIKVQLPKNTFAKVALVNPDHTEIFSTVCDKNGTSYLFAPEKSEQYLIKLEYYKAGESQLTVEYHTVSGDCEFDILAENAWQNNIQIAFVIDATGSMTDEMEYLKAEIADVISKIRQTNSGANVQTAICVYRDFGDSYVVKSMDFTTNEATAQSFLSKQSADGGGDFPEAVQEAFAESLKFSWSDGATTKLVIHVADAPAHNNDCSDWQKLVEEFCDMGARIISVASSGIDKSTEYLFRSQSLISNGCYVYLTDESGIGNEHLEATVETRPVVEYLNACLIRLINGYHSGTFSAPIYYGNENSGKFDGKVDSARIEFVEYPAKNYYKGASVNEVLDFVIRDMDTNTEIRYSEHKDKITVEGFDLSVVGTRTATVYYGDYSLFFHYTVYEREALFAGG